MATSAVNFDDVLVNYDAAEIPGLMGRSTRWLASKLGPEYEREVVHRDDLVIL